MKGLFVWADSYCRSTLAFYQGLGQAFGAPLKVVVLRMDNPLRRATGFSDTEFRGMSLLPVPRTWDDALELLCQHAGWNHLFCAYQSVPLYRRLLSEASQRGYAVGIGSEAPCNMAPGWKHFLKAAYIRFVLPYKVRKSVRAADFILNYSGDSADDLAAIGWPRERIIPCGYYPPPLQGGRCVRRTRKHWRHFSILLTGKHELHRSPMLLLHALGELKEQGLVPECYITQEGPLLQQMKTYASVHGLANVHFLGLVSLERLRELYENCSLYVGTGNREPWGMRLNDALQSGAPLLVNEGMGGKKMVEELGCGLVFKHRDAHSLATCVKRLMEDQRLYLGVARQAYMARQVISPAVKAKEMADQIRRQCPAWH